MKAELEEHDIEAIAQRVLELLMPVLSNNEKSEDKDTLYTKKTLAGYLGVSVKWVDDYKSLGMPYLKLKGHVRFRKKDIDNWLDKFNVPAIDRMKRIMQRVT